MKTTVSELDPGTVKCHLKGGRGARRHRDEAAEEMRVADEEREGEGARVGGRDEDHAALRLRVRSEDGAD